MTILTQAAAIDELAKHATREISRDKEGYYVVKDKETGEILGRYETYRDAR